HPRVLQGQLRVPIGLNVYDLHSHQPCSLNRRTNLLDLASQLRQPMAQRRFSDADALSVLCPCEPGRIRLKNHLFPKLTTSLCSFHEHYLQHRAAGLLGVRRQTVTLTQTGRASLAHRSKQVIAWE